MRRTGDLFMKVLDQARFADPCFTDDQDHLALTFERALQTTHQRT
jgi:hypothetical protein